MLKHKLYQSKQAGTITISNESNQVTIHTEHLEFVSINQHNKPYLITNYKQLLEKGINVALFRHGTIWSETDVKTFIEKELKQWQSNDSLMLGTFSIHDPVTKRFMGSLMIEQTNEFEHLGKGHTNSAEISYILDEEYWRKGHGTVISIVGKKYIKHAINMTNDEDKKPKEIVATVHPDNGGSKRILEKTLKNPEKNEFFLFGAPRMLFYKPIKSESVVSTEEATIYSPTR